MKASKTLIGLLCSIVLTCLLVTVCFAQKYRPDPNSARDAIVKGEAKEFLSAMEAQGQEAEKNEKWAVAASAYNEATWAAQNIGQLQKALSYAGKALESAEKAKDQELRVRAILFLAQVHGNLRQFEKATEWTEKGIETAKKLSPGPFKEAYEGHFYRMSGADFLRRGDLQKAIEHLSYSVRVQDSRLSYFTSVKRLKSGVLHLAVHLVVTSLAQLAQAYQRTGNMEAAIKTYEKGIDLIKRFSARTPAESNLYQGLGQVYLAQKDFPRALENLKKALALAESQQRPTAISSANLWIGDVFNQSGKPAEAIPYYQIAIQQVESTRTLLQSEEHRLSYFEGALRTYIKMMNALLFTGKAEDAFNYGERARSRTFLDILGSKVQLSRVQGGLLEEERALQERIAALKAKSAVGEEEGAGTERESSRRELAEAEKAYEAFLAKVRKQDKEQASLMSVEPLTLKEVQELLEPGVSMLEYFVTEQEVLLWIVEKDKAQFVRVPIGRGELVAKVTSLRESIYNVAEKEKFKASSQELYGLLLKPALSHVRGKELLIVPHDVLHYVPFQALLSPQGKYLIQDYPIYYLSSASLMQFTREKRRAGGESALVMGNPSLGDEAYNLRFAEREAKEIAAVYPQSAVYVLAEASKPRAVSLSPKYDMLHFAVHAELNEDDPLSSALLLAGDGHDDGRLSVGEIFSLGLKAGMVVLSACETGLGKLSNGDEMIGLTRAFIYAGTPSVVTTLWKVSDRASYELMREFYQHLKTAKKSDALRQAQLKTMKQFPEPFYWAAYGLTGER
jgi:CHAT domain-containing protein